MKTKSRSDVNAAKALAFQLSLKHKAKTFKDRTKYGKHQRRKNKVRLFDER